MKVSFITTVFNEEETIERLLDSLLSQSKKPDEIVIVDGGSSDGTVGKIKKYKLRIKNTMNIRVFVKSGNRSVGRNEAIKHAKGEIIVCSDSGNILDKDWVKNITKPFSKKSVDAVAGYYQGVSKTVFQKCVIPYALVMPDKVDPNNFLPATRSIAFTKSIWRKVGGFNEAFSHNEDYVFARKLRDTGANIVFAKDALVYWLPRNNLNQTFIMMCRFAIGDAEAKIFRPKVLFVFLRYVVGLLLLTHFISIKSGSGLFALLAIFLLYLVWAVFKNYRYVKDVRALYLLPAIQLIADAAVLSGTTIGLTKRIK